MRPLTLKQERACQEFIKTGNKTAAYRIAYDCTRRNASTVNRHAHLLFKRDKIVARMQQLMAPAAKKAQVSVQRLLTEVGRVAFFDPRKLLDADGKIKPLEDLDDETAAALSIEVSESAGKQTRTLKSWDKNSAQDRLAKILRMFGDTPPLDAPGTVTIRVSGADQVVLGISAVPTRVERTIGGDS